MTRSGRPHRLTCALLVSGCAALVAPTGLSAQTDLPVVVFPPVAEGDLLAVMVSGDGNWSAADEAIADSLLGRGVPSVGLLARSYLRSVRRTPQGFARDLEALTRRYLGEWSRSTVVFIGYSRGASIGPVALSLWPPELQHRLGLVVLLGPSPHANFQFHWVDLVQDVTRPGDIPVLPALERLRGTPILCVYGTDEAKSMCRSDPGGLFRARQRPGGHRIGHAPEAAEFIVSELERLRLIPAA